MQISHNLHKSEQLKFLNNEQKLAISVATTQERVI